MADVQRGSNGKKVKLVVGAMAAIFMGAPPVSAAATPPTEQHCVVDITASETNPAAPPMDRGCYPTLTEALASVADTAQAWMRIASASSGAVAIGTHFTGQNYTGSSTTITGSGCNGSTWKPTGTWNNNIESSRNRCGAAGNRLYDASTCSGSSAPYSIDTPSHGAFNNRASCVRYG